MLLPPLVEPAYFTHPEYSITLGPEVCEVCADAGFAPDPEQELALNLLFALGPRALPMLFEFGIIAPRQNMKTGLMKQAALGWLFVTGERRIAWSAHEFDTARESFGDIVGLIENTPSLSRRLAPGPNNGIYSGSGNLMIELATGARLKFKARTKTGGRGLTGDKTILDEAFALTTGQIGSVLPTMSTRPNAQILYGSSACHTNSDVLHRLKDRGRRGDEPRLGYMEYSAEADCAESDCSHEPGEPGCAMDDEDNWRRANSQAGRRISMDYIRSERKAMDPQEFGRERLGWHDAPPAVGGSLISSDQWGGLLDPESTPVDPVAFGVYVSRDRSRAAIGVAARRKDGKIHVGIVPAVRGQQIESLPGTGWIVGRVKELRDAQKPCAVVIDDHSSAASLLPEFKKEGIDEGTSDVPGLLELTDAHDMAIAANTFYDAVIEDGLRHRGSAALARAVASAKTRDLADSWAWDRKDKTSDITQLVAVTLAVHGLIVRGEGAEETEVWGFWE
ncbi:terminase large subunit [Gordonia phage Eyre]|uniref:Terminase large subunit n=1 Tax=Gordonia phage Eyre TaxID=1887646 RepID=A0A1B3AZV7_9CAUD|nr:terminase large subunit [Gordonia phage Eyre]AOE44282.1 terminase large subunit [Gordonia phage Eyre]